MFERSSISKNFVIESFLMLVIFSVSWLGFGNYMAGLILLAFIFSMFSKYKREIIFQDKTLLVLLALFTLSSVISSLFSIDKLLSTFLSLLWFLIVFIPMSYVRLSLNEKNDFFIKWIIPVSFFITFVILIYLYSKFFQTLFTKGLVFKRYTFCFLGKATTPDYLVMLSGIGYGLLRQKKEKKWLWLSFLFLLFCGFGVALTYDRGGIVAFFVLTIILLSFDYKRLVLFFILFGILIYLSFKIDALKGIKHSFDYLYLKSSQESLKNSAQIATFRSAWGMIKDHWLLGVGTNNFSKFSREYGVHKWYCYAHNFILQFWAENGLFGMIFGLSIIGLVIYRWIKSFRAYKYKYIALGIGASFIGMLIGNLTNSTIWIIKVALLFWLLAGAINAIYFISCPQFHPESTQDDRLIL